MGREMKQSIPVLVFHILLNVLTFFLIFVPFLLYLLHRLVAGREYLFVIAILAVIFLILGPSFILSTSSRIRLPVEPFIFIYAFEYWNTKSAGIFRKLKMVKY